MAKTRKGKESTCTVCESENGTDSQDKAGAELWLECDACEAWAHWECARNSPEDSIEQVDKYYCPTCIEGSKSTDTPLETTYKESPRKTTRKTAKVSYASIEMGIENDPERWIRVAESKPMAPENFKRMKGADLNFDWVMSDPAAFTEPIVIETPDGLDMKMPRATMTVQDVANIVGHDTKVEVMDVASQNGLDNWTLGRWAHYFHDPARTKIRNVISLEVSDTRLSNKVIPPKLVRQLDWIETIWPSALKDQGVFPKVQKYCLMSVAKCWTDWHVDFAASSVYYHILSGGKTFFFIRPTAENLRKYEVWSGSHTKQESEWLGDSVDAVYRVDLKPGNTMIIPSGWIHSVYTPADALVFGGNFLHSLNIGTQLRLFEIEKKTKVPMKYRFPYFVTFCWYVGEFYTRRLEAALANMEPVAQPEPTPVVKSQTIIDGGGLTDFTPTEERKPRIANGRPKLNDPELSPRVLAGLKKLSIFLLEQGERFLPDSKASLDAKRWASDNLPNTITEPYEFAVTLRQRIFAALGEKDGEAPRAAPVKSSVPKKRKAPSPAEGVPKFKNFSAPEAKKTSKTESGVTSEQTERREPVTTVEKEKRARPNLNSFDDGDGPKEEVEVRTVTTETRVTKLARNENGRVVREVRTVTTVVERTTWESPRNASNNGIKLSSSAAEPAPASPAPLPALSPAFYLQNGALPKPQPMANGHTNGYERAPSPVDNTPILPPQRTRPMQSALPPARSANPVAQARAPQPQQPYLQFGAAAPTMPSYSMPAAPLPQPVYVPPVANPAAAYAASAYAPKAAYGIPAAPVSAAQTSSAYYAQMLMAQAASAGQQQSAYYPSYGYPAPSNNGSQSNGTNGSS